ncbi:engulfment and cell motility protein 1 isoform 2 [Cricetulus griseus]|nr:engulfment and cell motility protein 1 isoform 2 [Cricetulus griseus]
MPPPADIVKVAIEWPGAYPKLMEIDQCFVRSLYLMMDIAPMNRGGGPSTVVVIRGSSLLNCPPVTPVE